jgi:hypothetical protein
MKTFRPAIILFAVAALLGGYIYFFERGPVKPQDEEKKVKIFPNFIADDIQEVHVESLATTQPALKTPLVIKKDAQGVWQIQEPKQFKADEVIMRSLLNGVGDFNPDSSIDNPAHLADYGLNSPTARFSFIAKNNVSNTLLVGDKNVPGTSFYVKTPFKNTVYLLPAFSIDNIKRTVNDYRDRNILKTDPVSAQKIQITYNGKILVLEKDKNNVWYVKSPVLDKADENKVRDFLNSVNNLRIEDFVEDKPANLAVYGLSKPRAVVEIWPNGGEASTAILIGRQKLKTSNTFIKVRSLPSVALIGQYFEKTLDFKVADFRDKSVMKFDASSAQTLTIHHNDATYVYKKGDQGKWTSDGRVKADDEGSSLIGLLSGMTINDFADKKAETGLAHPSFTAEVALKDGTLRKYRFGKRDKEEVFLQSDKTQDVYRVAANAVSQLEVYFSSMLTPVPAITPTPVKK